MSPMSARSRSPMIESVFDRIEERPRLVSFQDRRLAALHDMLRPAHGRGRIHRNDLSGHQEIEEHADRGKMLLHGGRRARMVLDIGGDDDGGDLGRAFARDAFRTRRRIVRRPPHTRPACSCS